MRGEARILVVDDDEDICFIVTRTLEKMGYEVLGVTSGLEAMHSGRKAPFVQRYYSTWPRWAQPGEP